MLAMAGMANAVSNVNDQPAGRLDLELPRARRSAAAWRARDRPRLLLIGGSASGSSYDSKAASQFASNLSQHADSSSRNM